MTEQALPLILEPEVLERHLGEDGLLVVDVSRPETYAQLHIPGAVFLDYVQIVRAVPPRMGLLPEASHLTRVLSGIGVTPDTHVVAYDDEGGGRAGRLLWTLDVAGHEHFSLLNGGLHAWANEGHPVSREPVVPRPSQYEVRYREGPLVDRDFVLAHLHDRHVAILDARSPEEFRGQKVLSARGGHIPGAVNMEWTQAMDANRNLRLKPESQLRALLESLGVTPDKTVVTHCQTHHRSAHTYVVLKSLGYPQVKGYAGSWSDWGNAPDTPIEA